MADVRKIDVRKQKNLAPGQVLRLCVRGVTHRMLRSMLTLAVIVLAVAFFMFLLSENMFIRSIGAGVADEVMEQRLASRLLDHLYTPPPPYVLSRRMAQAKEHGMASVEEFAAVTGWKQHRVAALARRCATAEAYVDFLEGVTSGKRILLVGKTSGYEMLDTLAGKPAWGNFEKEIKNMPDLVLPGGMTGFRQFLDGYQSYRAELIEFAGAWEAGVRKTEKGTQILSGGKDIETWLAECTPAELGTWGNLVRSAGFQIAAGVEQKVQGQIQDSRLRRNVMTFLDQPASQDAWKKVFKLEKRISMDKKLLSLEDPRAAKVIGVSFSTNDLSRVMALTKRERRLSSVEKAIPGALKSGAAERALGTRQLILLFISFIVCMAGIANAMLMSITERFREIATMKCLGATDHYILQQFMMEAALQGVMGGILGMFLGFMIATIKYFIAFGGYAAMYWPGMELLSSAGISLGVGVFLAVLASIYPSWAASRMAPMEAMRVE